MLVTLEVEAPLAPANTTFEFDIGGHGGSHGSAIKTNKKVLIVYTEHISVNTLSHVN